MFVVFFVSALAETNRSPFDLPEGESELVAGFYVEYSAMTFALFYLGEYANMILMSAMTSILFLGGWLPPFDYRAASPGCPGVDLVRRSRSRSCCSASCGCARRLPRFRYDQLMRLGWKVFLPLSLVWLVLTAGVLRGDGLGPALTRRKVRRWRSSIAARARVLLTRARLGHVADACTTCSSRR